MTADPYHDLIFAHRGNARVAASAVMAGTAAVLVGGALMAIGSPSKLSAPGPHEARNATLVRVIGAVPNDNVPCEQQVWPHIAQHCLTQARATAAADPAREKPAVAENTAKDNAELTPLTAASVDHGTSIKDDATSGQGVQEDTAVLREQDATRLPADATLGAAQTEEAPPTERPRRHVYRHVRFPFHVTIGGFRF